MSLVMFAPAIPAWAAAPRTPVRPLLRDHATSGANRLKQAVRSPLPTQPRTVTPSLPVGPGVGGNGPISPPSDMVDILTTTAAALDPTAPSQPFVSANLTTGAAHVVGFTNAANGFYQPVDLPRPQQPPNDAAQDTAVAFDGRGLLYDAYVPYSINNTGAISSQLVIARSTDKGLDWGNPVRIDSPANIPEKPGIAVDQTGGLHANRLYVAYDAFPAAGGNPIMLAHSDGGLSWSRTSIYQGDGNFGAAPVVDGNGTVVVAWDDWCYPNPSAACDGMSGGRILVTRSTDGGLSVSAPVQVATTTIGFGASPGNYGSPDPACGGPALVSPTPSLAVDRSGGVHDGYLYLTWGDIQPASPPGQHIFFSRSTDGGLHWEAPRQIDGDNLDQSWQAAVTVDQTTGVVALAWYDRRDETDGTSYRLFYAQSSDGGATFSKQIAVADQFSTPMISCGGTGDGIQLVAANGSAQPFWTDTRNGTNQIFGASVDEAAVPPDARLFAASRNYAAGPGPSQLAAKDFNGDGKPDIVVGNLNLSGGNVGLLVNQGNGVFGPQSATAAGPLYGVAAGDFNGDGKQDVAILHFDGSVSLALGNGDGTLKAPSGNYVASGQVASTDSEAVADLNGDGRSDLVTLSRNAGSAGSVIVWYGMADGTLSYPTQIPVGSGGPSEVAAGDMNGDGHPDLVIANSGDGSVSVLLNSGGTSFTLNAPYRLGTGPVGLLLADFNRDGRLDVAAADTRMNELWVRLGNGDGTLQVATQGAGGPGAISQYLASGDFDHDGVIDIASSLGFGRVIIWRGHGDGSFERSGIYTADNGSTHMVAADLNGDGGTDLAVANWGYQNADVSVLLQAPPPPPPPTVAVTPSTVDLGTASFGTTTASAPVTITNTGTSSLHIAMAKFSGASDFMKTADRCSGATLAPSASCQVQVAFRPVAAQSRGATLSIVDDGAASPQDVFVSAIGVSSTRTVYEASTNLQYQLVDSDGASWTNMDSSGLFRWISPSADSTAVISVNTDLWTANAGVNQDVGIEVGNQLIAWKESGGFAGTFSPNAAFVVGTVPMTKDHLYDVKVVWKTNKAAPNSTIYAGAGLDPKFSPTTLTVKLLTHGSSAAQSTDQYSLKGGNGTAWQAIDGTQLALSIPASSSASTVILSANADLWTEKRGVNQDLGIFVDGQLKAWKESGGFAGTFSPNAAFVQTVVTLAPNSSHTVDLRWKTNVPTGGTIHAGAGLGPQFSPTTLMAQVVTSPVTTDVSTDQFILARSDGTTWQPLGGLSLALPVPAADGTVMLSAGADLWTQTAGVNQDIGIWVSGGAYGSSGRLIAWKESGGFAGTFSPNAAFLQTVIPVAAGGNYTVSLRWKSNVTTTGTIRAGAGLGPQFSPTSLTAEAPPS